MTAANDRTYRRLLNDARWWDEQARRTPVNGPLGLRSRRACQQRARDCRQQALIHKTSIEATR